MDSSLDAGLYPHRLTHRIHREDLVEVLCHRQLGKVEEYFVRWQTRQAWPAPPRAPCSWHPLSELDNCLYLVQKYVENRDLTQKRKQSGDIDSLLVSRKRKREETTLPSLSRDSTTSARLTPALTSDRSRSTSVLSANTQPSSGTSSASAGSDEPRAYGLKLFKKEGRIIGKKSKDVNEINPRSLPQAWLDNATVTPVTQAKYAIRMKFLEMLRNAKDVYLENTVDDTTPSLDFKFINSYIFRNGITAHPPEAVEGCQDPCKPNMGGNCGCEYTRGCRCLELAEVNGPELEKKDPELYARWKRARKNGEMIDTMGMPKRFPYSKPSRDFPERPQTLDRFYLEQRHAIYECNDNCNCGPGCKSRLVQNGRRVGLTIFKTASRGWGVYCNEDLIRGEFIDVYVGEVITSTEAGRREGQDGMARNSYLYTLDKHADDLDPTSGAQIEIEDCHVVDGQFLGNATRFINHSCEPNLRQYTVSLNKNDPYVYQLAFFAYEDIAAGTELTFDYHDLDEEEEDEAVQKRLARLSDPANADKPRCLCRSKKCRGLIWEEPKRPK